MNKQDFEDYISNNYQALVLIEDSYHKFYDISDYYYLFMFGVHYATVTRPFDNSIQVELTDNIMMAYDPPDYTEYCDYLDRQISSGVIIL